MSSLLVICSANYVEIRGTIPIELSYASRKMFGPAILPVFSLVLFSRIEIQYKHLLTLWRNRHWHLKQALANSGAPSGVQVIHTVAGEKVNIIRD